MNLQQRVNEITAAQLRVNTLKDAFMKEVGLLIGVAAFRNSLPVPLPTPEPLANFAPVPLDRDDRARIAPAKRKKKRGSYFVDPALKKKGIKMLKQGRPYQKVAKLLKLAPATVEYWQERIDLGKL